jgi:L-asparaginase II
VHKRTQIADALLNRLLDSSGSSFDTMNERTVRSALRAMRNRVIVNSGTMSVYKEDDQTVAWEGTLSNTADVTVNPDGGIE